MTGILRVVRPYTGRLLLAALAGVAAELCALGLIAAAAWLIARAAEQPPLAALSLAIVAVRGFAIFKGVFRYLERLAGHDVALRALADLRGRVYETLASRRTATRDGDAVVRMVADVDAVQDLVLRVLLPVVTAVLAGGAAIGLCTSLLPPAGAVLAGGLLLAGVAVPVPAALATRRTAARVVAERDRLAVRGLDVLDGAADLAAFGATRAAVAAATDAATRLGRLERRAAAVTGAAIAAGILVQGLTTALVTLVGVRSGADGVRVAVLALTALVAVETALALTGAAQRLVEIAPAARRLAALLGTPPPRPPADPRALPTGPPALELLGVRVGYGDVRALAGIDLRVDPGRRIAIVGASGAGKSTLLAVLSGEAEPDAGVVSLGGHTLSAYDHDDVRRAVRGLTQDAHVFTTTIRANLTLAQPEATDAQLAAAARRARLDEVLDMLPDGWDTVVGEGGRGLSGGQRQRLLLARALLADPPVLVLDEPTEGLDTVTGDAIVADLLTVPGGGTLILVTHRLARLDAADEVVVLDRGRVVQRGAHEDLMARPGPYLDLWEAERLTEDGVVSRR